MRTIFRYLVNCFNYYKIKGPFDKENVFCFTFLSIILFVIIRLIAMMSYRDSVLERAKYTINEKEYRVRNEIRDEINKVYSFMFSIKPYKDEFWFNEEQVNYLNRKEINK